MTRQPVAEVLELPGMKLHYDVHGDLTDPGRQPGTPRVRVPDGSRRVRRLGVPH